MGGARYGILDALTICKDNVGRGLKCWGEPNSHSRLHGSIWRFDAHANHGDDDCGEDGNGG